VEYWSDGNGFIASSERPPGQSVSQFIEIAKKSEKFDAWEVLLLI
jgi:hypothetical protein